MNRIKRRRKSEDVFTTDVADLAVFDVICIGLRVLPLSGEVLHSNGHN